MCPSLRSFQPTRPTDLIQLECPLNSTRRPRSARSAARLSTISQRCTRLRRKIARRCICSVEAQAVCSARGDANSHGNDEWENDHEVRIVKSQDTSPPVELHRKFPVTSLLLRLGRQHMRIKLCAQCDRRIVKPVIAIRPNCQRATPRLCQPGLVRRYRVCVLRRALQCHSSTALESASLSRCSRRLVEQ